MNKEIKKEKSKLSRSYIIIALIVVIIGGIMFFKTNNTDTVKKQETVVATKVEPKEEKTVARIDLTTPLVDADKPQFEVYVDGSKTSEKQAAWWPNFGFQGYVIQKVDNSTNFVIEMLEDAEFNIILRGPSKRDENKKFIPIWVDYTSFTINGEEVLLTTLPVWHNKPFVKKIKASKGKKYKVKINWTKHKEI